MTEENRWSWEGERLSTSYRSLLYVRALVSLFAFAVIFGAVWFTLENVEDILAFDLLPIFILIFAAALLRAIIRPWRYHASWRFQTCNGELRLRRGVLTRVETLVPFSRVQHIDVERGPLERIFGLASLVLHTAGTRGASVILPGLSPERAEQLRGEVRSEVKLHDEAEATDMNAAQLD